MKSINTLITAFILINSVVNAQSVAQDIDPVSPLDTIYYGNKANPFTYEAAYVGEFAGNVSGGIKRGMVYLGMASIIVNTKTGNLGIWDGGEFFINGACTHGGTPSATLIGDFQVASNIEAGNRIYLHELWYKQTFGISEFLIGLQDLNAEFIVSEIGGTFLNSSFGIPSLISDNIPVSIFPLTALGITVKFHFNENFIFQAAVYDGMPESTEENQYNLNWKLKNDDGASLFGEVQLAAEILNLPGTIKAGGYYHSCLKEKDEESASIETIFNKNYGFYLIADQKLWESNNSSFDMFVQLTMSPKNINAHNYYFGCGINYSGIFDDSGADIFGLAFANAGFHDYLVNSETTIETFYKLIVNENIFIQPDLQFIINPAGADEKLDNALAAFVRFGFNF
jgi:porin